MRTPGSSRFTKPEASGKPLVGPTCAENSTIFRSHTNLRWPRRRFVGRTSGAIKSRQLCSRSFTSGIYARAPHCCQSVVCSCLRWQIQRHRAQKHRKSGCSLRSPASRSHQRRAALHAKELLPLHQDFVHEGILGTTFTGRLVAEARVGPYAAVVPTISGRAFTGIANYVVDPDDPFPTGYTVGDIWGAPG
jgi:hypothetical protein